MLQQPAHNGPHPQVFPPAGVQAAHAAHDQIDFHACVGGLVEQFDDLGVYQGVDFRGNPGGKPFFGVFHFPADQAFDRFAQMRWRGH